MRSCSSCWQGLSEVVTPPSPSDLPCHWWWMLCGRCGASALASMTTSTPVPWRRGSMHWKMSSLFTSLWLRACQQVSSCSWPISYGENNDRTPATLLRLVLLQYLSLQFSYLNHVTAHIWIRTKFHKTLRKLIWYPLPHLSKFVCFFTVLNSNIYPLCVKQQSSSVFIHWLTPDTRP